MLRFKTVDRIVFLLLLVCGTILTLFATTQRLYKEEDSSYFALTMLVLPGLVFLAAQARLRQRFVRASLTILYWLTFYMLYVDYQDHPWFAAVDPRACDGQCSGWYSFENAPIYGVLLACGALSLVSGLGIHTVICGGLYLWRTIISPRSQDQGKP
jgi:hypothetical protein